MCVCFSVINSRTGTHSERERERERARVRKDNGKNKQLKLYLQSAQTAHTFTDLSLVMSLNAIQPIEHANTQFFALFLSLALSRIFMFYVVFVYVCAHYVQNVLACLIDELCAKDDTFCYIMRSDHFIAFATRNRCADIPILISVDFCSRFFSLGRFSSFFIALV